jgi:sulfofructose kinase
MKKKAKQAGPHVYDCIGLGFCVVDYQCLLDRFPEIDEKTVAKKYIHQGGAPVVTALVALGKWKRGVAMIGIAGDDDEGRFITKEMAAYGVDTSHMILTKKTETKKAFVWIDLSTGTRTMVLGRERVIPLPASAAYKKNLPFCRVLHVDGNETPVALKAMRLVRERGGETVIDLGRPREHMDELFTHSDHFIASHTFVKKFFGERATPEDAVWKILDRGPKAALITLGEKGCIGATAEGEFRVPGFKREGFIVDTTGAGDVFHGGYIHGLLAGWPPKRCAEFANAAAFLSCGSIGARAGIPSLSKVMSLITEDKNDVPEK